MSAIKVLLLLKSDPFVHERELIVVPNEILPGLLTAMHIHFNHASKSQLAKLFDRHFYAISYTEVIQNIVNSCMRCNSLKSLNKELFEQTSTPSPTTPGQQFAADVIERCVQKILVVREVLTSFTVASIICDQKADTIRSGILNNTSLLRLPSSMIRVDNGPGFLSLKGDKILSEHGIQLDFGRVKNVNKNPVAERGNQELEHELLRIDASGSPVTATTLQNAVKSLNTTRIRNRGLSSQEMMFCRDQITGERLAVDDLNLSRQQKESRSRNHPHSSLCKAKGAPHANAAAVTRGDLVFIKSEGSKHKPRKMYLVMDVHNGFAGLQKLDGAKFQSRRYEVPLTNIFPAIRSPAVQHEPHDSSSSDSDDDDVPMRTQPAMERHPPEEDDVSSESNGEGDDDEDEEDPPYVPPTDRGSRSRDRDRTIVPPTRRPPRSHNLPARLAGNEWVR